MTNETDKPSALQLVADAKQTAQIKLEETFAGIQTYDWEQLPPPIVAKLLTYKPWPGGANNPDYYMSYPEALIVALRANKLGVDPFSDECFYDPKSRRLNLTLEGEIAAARKKGLVFSVPSFERKTRPFPAGAAIAGLKEDLGVLCKMQIKTAFGQEVAEAMVWASEGWYVSTNPNWVKRTWWMLEVRAQSNAIKNCSGVGVSANISDAELSAPVEEAAPAPAIRTSKVPFIPQTAQLDDLAPVLEASIAKADLSKNKP